MISQPLRSNLSTFRLLLILCVPILAGSCSRGPDPPLLVEVSGKVLDGDQPVTAGSISFHPDSSNAYQQDKPSSLLQVDGSFTMKTFPFGEGVPLGKYKVTLSPDLASRMKKPKLSRPEETPWEIEVKEDGVTDIVFQVTSNQ